MCLIVLFNRSLAVFTATKFIRFKGKSLSMDLAEQECMWVLKIEKTAENSFLAALAQRYGVSFSGYPINHHLEKDGILVNVAGFVEGTDTDVEKFARAVSREKAIQHIAHNKNFILASLKLAPHVAVLYNPAIIFIEPAMYGKNGNELLHLGCWEKEPLMTVVEEYKKRYDCKILMFTQKKIDTIGLINVHPDLTEKQRYALQLAVTNGYYDFPKRITLEKLSKIMKVSFSTYHAHLSKAESKFIPEMVGKFLK